MIYDRAYIDIIEARKIFSNKIQRFISLTEEEQGVIDKAFFNLTAVNRITSKINEIWLLLVDAGAEKVDNADVREWGEQEIFIKNNFSNIRQNIAYILTQLNNLEYIDDGIYQTAYAKLNAGYTYTNLNNLEKLLFDIYNALSGFAVKSGNNLYILGAYTATLSGEELIIE